MKVIEKGILISDENIIKCSNCDCVFKYNIKDFEEKVYDANWSDFIEYYYKIICPECNRMVRKIHRNVQKIK